MWLSKTWTTTAFYEPLAGDVGLAGVTIQLTGTNDLGPIAATTTTTASDGSYSFSNLRAGSYEVSQLWPAPVGYFLTGASPVRRGHHRRRCGRR